MSVDAMAMLKADLPNTPDEVLEEWLKPYADMIGWPPTPNPEGPLTGRWVGILRRKPISFWRQVRWESRCEPLEVNQLSAGEWDTILQMRDAYVLNKLNPYSSIGDGKERLGSILRYVIQEGRIPSVIAFLKEDNGLLSVVDGHHRLVAYFLNRAPNFRKRLPPEAVEFDLTVRKWIASPVRLNSSP